MKTRYTLLYILTALLSIFSAQTSQAQVTQDALYIYRNDGGFNGFYYADIERIEYSKIDTLGVEQADYVVQEIYALDTLYRIPISAIDSVTFVTPETVYKEDVVHTTESKLWDYVIDSDTATVLVLAANTPTALIPKAGDKIVTTKSRDHLPIGFYGRVVSVENGTAGITVKCETPDLTELFDQWVCKAAARTDDPSDQARSKMLWDENAAEFTLPLYEISNTVDLTNLSYGLSDEWSVTGTGYLSYGLRDVLTLRVFLAIRPILGINFDYVTRMEKTSWFDLNIKGGVSGTFDMKANATWTPIPDTPFAVETEAGFSVGASGETELKIHRLNVTSDYGMMQYNDCFYDELRESAVTSTHLLTNEEETSFTGTLTFTAGPYFFSCLSLGKKEIAAVGTRYDAGLKATVSAELKMVDYLLATMPSLLPAYMILDPTPLYDYLNRDGSVTFGPFCTGKLWGNIGPWKKEVEMFEVTTPWKVDGGLVPEFKNTEITFDENKVPTASVELRRPALLYPPVGFAAYYTKSGKQLGKTLWFTDKYKESELKNYSMQLPKFGGGKEVTVYPTVKLLRLYELLASPYASYTVPAEMTVKPNMIETTCDPIEERFTVTDNLDHKEDKYERTATIEFGENVKPWFDGTWDGDDYIVNISRNDSIADRKAEITITTFNKDESIKLEQIVTVKQEAPESKFSVKPDKLEVPGYSKDFQAGQLTQKLTIVYPRTANVSLTSSDESWLKIDTDWLEKKDDGLNITATRNIRILPNPSLENKREGTITIEMQGDGSSESKTVTVIQSALNLKVELEPDEITLSSQEKAGAEYSEKQTVSINRDPFDEYLAKAVKSEEATPSEDWLEASVKKNNIELRAKANPNEEERTATVKYTITMTDGSSLTQTLKVTQQKFVLIPPFTVSPETIRFSADGGELTVSLIGDDVDRIKEVDFHSLKWVGGGGMHKSLTIVAQPNPNEEERIGNVDIYAYMTDGSVSQISKLIYQDGKGGSSDPNPTPDGDNSLFNYITIVAYAKANMSDDEGTDYDVENPIQTAGAFNFTPENSNCTLTEYGNTVHIECQGYRKDATGGGGRASLSFDIDKSTKTIKNLQYSQDIHSTMSTFMPTPYGVVDIDILTEGHMKFSLGSFPIQTYSSTYKEARSTEASGLVFTSYDNYADVTGTYSDDTPSTTVKMYYEYVSDPSNSVELCISAKTGELALEWPSEEVMKSLEDGGMPVNEGSTPPKTEGTYLLSPLSVVADNQGVGEELSNFSGMVVKFSDHQGDRLKFDYYIMVGDEASVPFEEETALIQGDGQSFSVCVPYRGEEDSAFILSGTFTNGEVQNLHFASTPMKTSGKYLIMKDGDGKSEKTTWAPAPPEDDE